MSEDFNFKEEFKKTNQKLAVELMGTLRRFVMISTLMMSILLANWALKEMFPFLRLATEIQVFKIALIIVANTYIIVFFYTYLSSKK
jgi:hypothetical protein